MSKISEMQFIKSLAGRPYEIKTHANYAQVKLVHGDKFYLGRANGDTLRRIHRKATQAELYAEQVTKRLRRLRLKMIMAAMANKIARMPTVHAVDVAEGAVSV